MQPNITASLIVICLVVFILQLGIGDFTDYFALSGIALDSRPWIIITSIFMHGSINHLIFNMLALFMFGLILEEKTRKDFYLLVFLVSGFTGSLGFLYFASTPLAAALGASGAIYGIIGALFILEPKLVVFVQGIPMPMYIAGPVYAVIELFGLGLQDNIAHSAHLLGFLGGLALATFWRLGLLNSFRTRDYAILAIISLLASLLVGKLIIY